MILYAGDLEGLPLAIPSLGAAGLILLALAMLWTGRVVFAWSG